MEFRTSRNPAKFINLMDQSQVYSGPTELTQCFNRETSLYQRELQDGQHLVVMKISLGRRLIATILTAFMPTILLVVVGHATNFFKVFFFEVNTKSGYKYFVKVFFFSGRSDS